MVIFLLGAVMGILAGGTGVYYLVLRDRMREAQEWIDLYQRQQAQLAERAVIRPRAVTRLSNRERTIEI